MKKNSRIQRGQVLAAGLLISLVLIATSEAQTDLPAFTGTFTLATQVHWNNTALQPGEYTITIGSTSMPIFVLVRDSKGRPVARFMARIDGGRTSARNVLLLQGKSGQLGVYSLALGSLGRILVFDSSLAREAVLEARAPQMVQVTSPKR